MSKREQVIFFAHIPKCAGKSFGAGLKSKYGDSLKTYYPLTRRWRPNGKLRYGLWKTKNIIKPHRFADYYDIIYGHYCFDDLRHPPGKQVLYGAFFREPLAWVGSFFFYQKQKYDRLPKDPIAFIQKLGLQNGFRQLLGNVNPSDMDFIGLQETFEESLLLYDKIFSKKIEPARLNKTKNAPVNYARYFEEQGILPDVQRLMQENRELYEEACARYVTLKQQYGI